MQEQCSTSRQAPAIYMQGAPQAASPSLPARLAHAILQCRTLPYYTHAVQDGPEYISHKQCVMPSDPNWGQSCQRPSKGIRRQTRCSACLCHPHASGPYWGLNRRCVPAKSHPAATKTRPPCPGPRGMHSRLHAMRAGQAQNACLLAAIYKSKHRKKQGDAGLKWGYSNPSISAQLRLAGRGRLVLLVAGRQEAIGVGAHAVIPLAPLLLPRHVLWPRVLCRVLCNARPVSWTTGSWTGCRRSGRSCCCTPCAPPTSLALWPRAPRCVSCHGSNSRCLRARQRTQNGRSCRQCHHAPPCAPIRSLAARTALCTVRGEVRVQHACYALEV